MEQRVGACGGERREDRQAEGSAKLLARVQESGCETGLVLADTGVGRGGGADENRAEAEGGDQESRQDVRDVGAVDRDP